MYDDRSIYRQLKRSRSVDGEKTNIAHDRYVNAVLVRIHSMSNTQFEQGRQNLGRGPSFAGRGWQYSRSD